MDTQELGFHPKGFNAQDTLNKLIEMVQAIQRGEESKDCFGTARVKTCQDHTCIWRTECQLVNEY
ncbi:MAG TPA: hypothetical protein PLG17_01425 [Thermodesulfobacteriota bacterium]|nr:hypothetical protein [Deltaproteobacteria bacterium]HNU72364.1 hypothetical protein [Thermodesulfobacteriota bacterium]HOC39322.1 hypothetical protein [Thermodesulfobacteriota bacterium]HQO77151.1 hypothetical protein [Thermodesulfobacteriota bacterium]